MTRSTGKPNRRVVDEIPEQEPPIKKGRRAPGRTIENRENQLISLAVDVAEKQLRHGTASSQVITHFLKLGSSQALLEKAKLERETALLTAKTEALESQKRVEELYANALSAMRTYSGQEAQSNEDD